MTRLWTKDFRCAICLREGSFGWLYRCTQDRELLLEDDMARGHEDNLDELCDIFDSPPTPGKRSPAARMSKLSFLEEISDQELKNYTPAQLCTILTQRSEVLDLAQESESDVFVDEGLQIYVPVDKGSSPFARFGRNSPSRSPARRLSKPWLPAKGGECQFKCCHFCRPTLVDRSFLSLNGIANGDIPPTAITGFGFHLQKKRPIGLVKHVLNLGLRPSAPPQPKTSRTNFIQERYNYTANSSAEPGQLIVANAEAAKRSPMADLPVTATNLDNEAISLTSGSSEPCSPKFREAFRKMATADPREHVDLISTTMASLIPLPPQTSEELASMSGPLTPMEENELHGSFGSAPLEVHHGVAVTEEAVELHVPDLITHIDSEYLFQNGS